MKMKKIVSIAVSALLLVSIAAAGAFAAEVGPSSPTSEDKDTGTVNVSISGTGDVENLQVSAAATEASTAQENELKSKGAVGYLGNQSASSAAGILGVSTDRLTINSIKELSVSGYDAKMANVTVKVPFAALPAEGTRVAVLVRLSSGSDVVLDGVVVEDTVTSNGVTSKVRKVQFTMNSATVASVQAGTAFVAAVTVK